MHVLCAALHADITKTLRCNELLCRTFCRARAPRSAECSDCTVSSCRVTVCQGPRVAVSRCRGMPSSSAVDVSRVQDGRWMFAKLSLSPGSKSVWADGQKNEESTANPAAAGSATFSLVHRESGRLL